MSTRCNVCIKLHKEDLNKILPINKNSIKTNEEYPYMFIYIHHDGYISGVGSELYKNLITYEDVKNFILKGNRTSYETSYTECGEDWESNKPRAVHSVDGEIPNDYFYLFDEDNEWYYKSWSKQNEPWKLLKNEFPELRDERIKNAIDLSMKIYEKTIAHDITPIKLEEIGSKIKELIENLTNGKYTTNGESGLAGKSITAYKKED